MLPPVSENADVQAWKGGFCSPVDRLPRGQGQGSPGISVICFGHPSSQVIVGTAEGPVLLADRHSVRELGTSLSLGYTESREESPTVMNKLVTMILQSLLGM